MRKPNPRTLAIAFLLVSAAVSAMLLGARNLYDDEIFSLDLITRPAATIVSVCAEGDVHPPGMYLLAHFAHRVIPSFRWMNLFPLILMYAGLSIFLLQLTPRLARTRSQVCLLLLATLHPQLLMWSGTFRWYGWWTGLALIALSVALQPSNPRPALGAGRGIFLGFLLACLFYLNYITFLFVVALGAAMLVRFREQPRKLLFTRAAITLGLFVALIAPGLRTMVTVHMPMGRAQRYGVAISFLRLVQSVCASEAYLPWHPLAVLAMLVFAMLGVVGMVGLVRVWRGRAEAQPTDASGLASIVVFGLVFFLLVAGSGLGGKPRNGLLLVPVLATAVALIVGTLHRRAQDAILLFFALWSGVGIAHLLGRYGLTKAFMNDRPEQVVGLVERTTGAGCAVVVTYDSGLAFALTQADLPRTLIVSPFRGPIFGAAKLLPAGCIGTQLYAVQSYLGEGAAQVSALNGELGSAMRFIEGEPRKDQFSFDPDAGRKRNLARLSGELATTARLPDYRYVVTWGAMDGTRLGAMRRQMPHFLSGYEVSVEEGGSLRDLY
jgi:hypothetical protein